MKYELDLKRLKARCIPYPSHHRDSEFALSTSNAKAISIIEGMFINDMLKTRQLHTR